MLYGWNGFKGWRVLEFFLNTNRKTHVKGFARELKISPGTAQVYLKEYEKQGILEKEHVANSINYRLAETPLTIELKKTYFLSLLREFAEEFIKENPHVSTLALYGSHAKGNYDEKSDIDLLAISQVKKIATKAIEKLESKIGKEARIQVFTVAEWKSMINKGDNFAKAVSENHIILQGEEP